MLILCSTATLFMRHFHLPLFCLTLLLSALSCSRNQDAIEIVSSAPWTASWIGTGHRISADTSRHYPSPYFRKEIVLSGRPRQARIDICGLGFYELYINGRRVGDKVLTPAVTNYDDRSLSGVLYPYDDQSQKRCLYDSYDVSSMLRKGANAIGVVLGTGWYNQWSTTVEGRMWYDMPRVAASLELSYGDGSSRTVLTDSSWKMSEGPLLEDSIFIGEVYDARRELGDWTMPGYDDSGWEAAVPVRAPSGRLMPNKAPADRVIRSLDPVLDSVSAGGSYHFSIPETISGWVCLKDLAAAAGDTVDIRFFTEEGLTYRQADRYICSGKGAEAWSPRFTWHNFRRFVVESPFPVSPRNLTVLEVRTDLPVTGSFRCSDTLLNKIFDAYVLTQNANLHGSISSDCPHRERLAYTGDAVCGAPALMFVYGADAFYRKWLDDMEDARNRVTGYVPHTAPFGGGGGGPAWGSAIAVLPLLHYLHYGDESVLRGHFEAMKQWVGYLGTRTDSRGIVVREEPNGWCLGDWCAPGGVQIPEPLVNTCYYYRCARIVSEVAQILGEREDERAFAALAGKIADDFNAVYLDTAAGRYWEGRQGSDAIPLAFGMVPEEHLSAVASDLLRHTEELDYHFDTGIIGTPCTLDALTLLGRADEAYRLLSARGYPGYDYLLDPANSTLWEYWDGRKSRCHPMFGSVVGWMFTALAGVDLSRSDFSAGKLVVEPRYVDGLSFVDCSFQTPQGMVRINWERTGADPKPRLSVSAPAGLQVETL